MQTKFTMSAGGVPAGSYNASFTGLEEYEENTDRFGEGVSLHFEISGGDHDGETATRICSKKFSAKSNLYKFAKALKGDDLETGEDFDFADHVGAEGMLIVEETEGGSTRVATFLRSKEASEKPTKTAKRSPRRKAEA